MENTSELTDDQESARKFKSEVNSYEDICRILNIDPDLEPDVSAYDEEDKEAAISMFKLWKANKAAWNGEAIDFNKYQSQYEIYCDLSDEADSGFGFAYYGNHYVSDYTHVSARLLWPSSFIAKHIFRAMPEDFYNMMKIPGEAAYLTPKSGEMNFVEEVNGYGDVCKILNIDPDLKPDVSAYDEEDKEAAVSLFRLWKASKAAWNGEVLDFNNDKQEKFEVLCCLGDEDSPLGFEYVSYQFFGSCTHVGARLLWPSIAIGKHLTEVMKQDFINMMKIPKR